MNQLTTASRDQRREDLRRFHDPTTALGLLQATLTVEAEEKIPLSPPRARRATITGSAETRGIRADRVQG
jgi:hypothetical protein